MMHTLIPTVAQMTALLVAAEQAHAQLPVEPRHDWAPFYAQFIVDQMVASETKQINQAVAEAALLGTTLSLI